MCIHLYVLLSKPINIIYIRLILHVINIINMDIVNPLLKFYVFSTFTQCYESVYQKDRHTCMYVCMYIYMCTDKSIYVSLTFIYMITNT